MLETSIVTGYATERKAFCRFVRPSEKGLGKKKQVAVPRTNHDAVAAIHIDLSGITKGYVKSPQRIQPATKTTTPRLLTDFGILNEMNNPPKNQTIRKTNAVLFINSSCLTAASCCQSLFSV